MSEFEKVADEIVSKITRTSVESIFGESREIDGQTIIPVGKIAYGWGGGSGKGTSPGHNGDDAGEGEGSGLGMGVKVKPMGYITITRQNVSYRPIIDLSPLLALGVTLAAWTSLRIVRLSIKRARVSQLRRRS